MVCGLGFQSFDCPPPELQRRDPVLFRIEALDKHFCAKGSESRVSGIETYLALDRHFGLKQLLRGTRRTGGPASLWLVEHA